MSDQISKIERFESRQRKLISPLTDGVNYTVDPCVDPFAVQKSSAAETRLLKYIMSFGID